MEIPTIEQESSIALKRIDGYEWDMKLSISMAGIVLRKGDDIMFYGLDGTIKEDKVSNLNPIKV